MHTATAKARTRFENVLFATDFSPASAQAIPFIRRIAKHFQSSLVAFHVKPPVVNPMTQPGSWPIDIEASKAADKKHREELIETFTGFHTQVVIEEGDIESNLQKAIDRHDVDLLVIGSRGRTGVAKVLLGSVAEEILRTVPCPVLTVGPHCDPGKANVREILFATDFAMDAPAAAAYAVSLAQEFQARLTMLHVVPESKPGELVCCSDVQESAKNLLRKLVPADAEPWCKPEYFVVSGNAAERILDMARLRDADLIILGAQPEKGIPGAATHLPIATAHKVLARANCPVLTVRSKCPNYVG
jgi:nucleotide-binding universal stress UspA family protein